MSNYVGSLLGGSQFEQGGGTGPSGGAGFTGRLGHPFARPGNIVLGFAFPKVPPPPARPWPDMPTTLAVAPHSSLAAVFVHLSTLTVAPHTTTIRPDAAPPD